jgi:hypothetical protein
MSIKMKISKEKVQRLLHSKAITQETLSIKLKDKLHLESAPNISRMLMSDNETSEKYLQGIADILNVKIEDIIVDKTSAINPLGIVGGVIGVAGIAALIGFAIASGSLSKKDKTDLINILKDD